MHRVSSAAKFSAAIIAGYGFAQLKSNRVLADGGALHPPQYPWSHRYPWSSYDHASIRRGYEVYSQVCSTCHSLDRIAYRNLVDVCFTEEEAKALAAERDFPDGPDASGEMFERPGKLTDYMPPPYPNEEAARAANNGAYPPDLSLMVKARHDGTNYIMALLNGYQDPPAGFTVREGLSYNPYFVGSAIAMPQPLTNDKLEFDDGTRGTISQMSKDVATFLAWTAEPEHDDRKKTFVKAIIITSIIAIPALFYKKTKWSLIKTRVLSFVQPGASGH